MIYLNLAVSAIMQGLIYAPLALGIFIVFTILDTADLTVDGSLVFGMTVCAVVTISGHPVLALFAGMAAGALAGLVTGLLQTKMHINPILSGILTMTALYTVNYMVLGGQSNRYLQYEALNDAGATVYNTSNTVFSALTKKLGNPELSVSIITVFIIILLCAVLAVFFKTRPGIAIRATGDNEMMVRSSSINADATRIAGIVMANALVGLSGALLCQQQKFADLNSGTGMLVMGLAAVIIGQVIFGKRGVTVGLISAAVGSIIYRIIIQFAYKINMPSYTVKLLSALIVVLALTIPVAKSKLAEAKNRRIRKGGAVK